MQKVFWANWLLTPCENLVNECLSPHRVSLLTFVFCKGKRSSAPFLKGGVVWWTPLLCYLSTASLNPLFIPPSDSSDFLVSHPLVSLFNTVGAIYAFSFSCPPTFKMYSLPLILTFWPKPSGWVEKGRLRKAAAPFSGCLPKWVRVVRVWLLQPRVEQKTPSYPPLPLCK